MKGNPCRTNNQDAFAQTGQSVAFELPAGNHWQDVRVAVPIEGESRLVRIHLPGARALEIRSIRSEAVGQKGVVWDFSGLVP